MERVLFSDWHAHAVAPILHFFRPFFAPLSYSYFSLDHYATVYLNDARGENQSHDAADDAAKSVRVFNAHVPLLQNPRGLAEMQAKVIQTPPAPSFAKKHPVWEKCCMGNKKTCKCGAPFFG
jgi:RNA exonuclease 4